MNLKFTKMNGAGNDFVVVDNRDRSLHLECEAIAQICDRHRGVGSDGLLVVEPSENGADFRMRYYNSDGGEAEMCGNGARCFARFAARLLAAPPKTLSFETPAGRICARFSGELVTINMSKPHSYRPPQWFDLNGSRYEIHFLNTGVPHAVIFVQDVNLIDVPKLGAAVRRHEAFAPNGTNANFAQVVSRGSLILRTYERGVEAETLACGTGVCAAAMLHHLASGAPSPISVRVQGGDTLQVGFIRRENNVFEEVVLTGPADFVFEGTLSL